MGNRSIAIFVGALTTTAGGARGSQTAVDYRVLSPGSLIVRAAVQTSGQDLVVVSGADLGGVGRLWFVAPSVGGSYPLTLDMTNAYGCRRTQTGPVLVVK